MGAIMTMTPLATWLLEWIQREQMSVREFGRKTGLGATTLNAILNAKPDDESYPSVKTLIQLADFTKTDICTLMRMVAPGQARTNARAAALAERISRLSPDAQEVIDNYLLGLSLKGSNQGNE